MNWFWPEVMQLSLHKMLIDGLESCGLLGIIEVYLQLFGLSFWRHPFTLEDPLVSMWCNAKFLQISADEETNSSISWMACGINFKQIEFLGELFL